MNIWQDLVNLLQKPIFLYFQFLRKKDMHLIHLFVFNLSLYRLPQIISVAGALTFFPPDPPLYKFTRTLDGEILPDTDEDDENDTKDSNKENGGGESPDTETNEQSNIHPAQALTERALLLRKRAKKRNARDALDQTRGVEYQFIPDPRLAPPPASSGSIEAIKIPHVGKHLRPSARSHVACVIYRIRQDKVTDSTKTIIYSHGNATDIGAMHFMQIIIAKGLKCNVVMVRMSNICPPLKYM